MSRSALIRFARRRAAKALALALVLSSFCAGKVYAATNWTAIQTAMKANGVVLPGDVLRFELVRQELSMTVNGVPVPAIETAAVANGFVAFKELPNGNFFADGSLPAQESELSALQDALLSHSQIHITATVDRLTGELPRLVSVHFEATGVGVDLATWLAAALETIHHPQIGVVVVPGVDTIIDPSTILPPNVLKLFNEGWVEVLQDIFVFYLPRPDESAITLDHSVHAQTGLGVGQSFYIQVSFTGGSNVTLNIDFALRAQELPAVQSQLRGGGFTLSSLSNHYQDENRRLFYLHASASGDGFALGNTLFNVIQIIQSSHGAGSEN